MPPIGWPEPYVALTLLAALLFAAGNALQKLGLTHRLPQLSAATWLARFPSIFAALLASPAWLLGLALTAAAFAMEMQALALGRGVPADPTPAQLAQAAVGAIVAGLAIVLMLWVMRSFPSVSTGHYVLPDHRVVSEGPYGRVRQQVGMLFPRGLGRRAQRRPR